MALTRPKYSQIYDTDWKQSVEVATTSDVGNLVLANVQPNSIDGVSVQTNYRILVKDQNSGAQNGIYLVRSAGTGSNGWWTRSLDTAESSFVTAGLTVTVVSGSVNGGKEFRLITPDPITLGTTSLTFINPFSSLAAAGANTQIQFNDATLTNATDGLTFNKYSNVLTTAGNIVSTSGYFLGNGSQLTGLPAGYSNVNAATYLVSGTLATAINTTANILSTGAIHNSLTVNGDMSVGTITTGTWQASPIGTAYGGTGITNNPNVLSITFIIDGGGSAITTGTKGDITIPFACTINEWTLLADQSGSIVVDIWKDIYTNYPPTVADTITGSAKPTITSSTKGQSSTLTGWTSSITAGDTIRFNVDSITSITRVTLSLKVTRT